MIQRVLYLEMMFFWQEPLSIPRAFPCQHLVCQISDVLCRTEGTMKTNNYVFVVFLVYTFLSARQIFDKRLGSPPALVVVLVVELDCTFSSFFTPPLTHMS